MWEKKNEGGKVIGKVKIFRLKLADDVVAVADSTEGLRGMLRDLEKYYRKTRCRLIRTKQKL